MGGKIGDVDVWRKLDWTATTWSKAFNNREAWGGKVTDEALAELVSLARRAFLDHFEEYVVETVAERRAEPVSV